MQKAIWLSGMAVAAVFILSYAFFAGGASGQESPPAAPAQGQAQPDPGKPDNLPVQTAEQAIASDAAAYARMTGVSQGEAVRRLRMQRDMGDLIERLRAAHKERLAGIVVDHEPVYRLRVRLTGPEPVAERKEALGGSELPVVFETGAKATYEALRGSLRANQTAVARLYPNLAGIGIDESKSEIVVTVNAPTAAAAEAARAKGGELKTILGQPFRIETTDSYPVLHDVRGGSLVSPTTSLHCTSAFVVKNTAGTTGVTTAAHCNNTLTYYNPNMTSIPLTLVSGSEVLDADQDVQVHTSAYVERPEFYWDDGKTAARTLTGRRLRSSTAYNDNVCHRGETTGYSCGYVQQTDYAPYNPTSPPCGGPCDPVYVRVTGATLECAGGDSGGPWFASTVAFGIHKGGPASGCSYAFYMSTDSITSGWSLLYGP